MFDIQHLNTLAIIIAGTTTNRIVTCPANLRLRLNFLGSIYFAGTGLKNRAPLSI